MNYRLLTVLAIVAPLFSLGCSHQETANTTTTQGDGGNQTSSSSSQSSSSSSGSAAGVVANVTQVQTSGSANGYTFAVSVASPDTGCEQYANWWEVVGADESLIYRRILGHSHVNEQPFTRSGGPVEIAPGDEVLVRAHMNTGGYGGQVMRGSVTGGFTIASDIDADYASALEQAAPQPDGCAF